MIRKKKKQEKENSVIERYNIRSAADAFRLLQDNSIPKEDRDKIEMLYKGEEWEISIDKSTLKQSPILKFQWSKMVIVHYPG